MTVDNGIPSKHKQIITTLFGSSAYTPFQRCIELAVGLWRFAVGSKGQPTTYFH